MDLDVYNFIRIIRYGNYNIFSVSRLTSFCKLHCLFFNELANPVKTTLCPIINPSPNCNCLASFGLSLMSS